MLIPCPYCGDRFVDEFTILGDAVPQRPEADGELDEWVDYVYFRDNAAGRHHELFYHVGGCRSWLIVERDTRTHEIFSVVVARRPGSSR
jgi:sarcosine oxidase subunit delta